MSTDKNPAGDNLQGAVFKSESGITRRSFLIGCGGLAAAGVAGGIIAREIRAVSPEWPALREGDPVPSRPSSGDPPFYRTPFKPSLEERRQAYLEWVTEKPAEEDGLRADLCRMELGSSLTQAKLQQELDKVNSREDTSDFSMQTLIRIYYKHADGDLLTAAQKKSIRQTFLDFKYWLDEPNPTDSKMELWTENHQILVHVAEFLAGQLFPDETFTNNGQSGRWRMQHARAKILRWMNWRMQTGFAEWDSVPYYAHMMGALLNLVDFADDEEISQKAVIMVDIMLLDMAADSFYGHYGTSHGRASGRHVKSAAGDNLVTTQALLWGLGRFQSTDNIASVSFATSERYNLPPVLEKIGQDLPEEMTNYERHSINVNEAEAEKYNLSFDDIEDVPIWWAMHAFTHPKVVDLTVHTANKWDLWHYPDFAPLADLGQILSRLGLLGLGVEWLGPDSNGMVKSQVNKVTYRTPDYMLSCAQDYRKGEKGYQHHIWQATLDPYAVVFVTNPGSLREGGRPGYWASQGRFPRAVQDRNVLISIYDIDRIPNLLEGIGAEDTGLFAFTHAYFPRWAFDEIKEFPANGEGNWILGRRNKGYIALYSHSPYEWQTKGPDADQELIVLGRQNVWICHLGREGVDGSFEEFSDSIAGALVEVNGLKINYESPGTGLYQVGWEGPFIIDGKEIPLRNYPRFNNPYCHTEYGQTAFTVSHGDHELELDFETNRRVIKG